MNIKDYLRVNHLLLAIILQATTNEKSKIFILVTSDYRSFIFENLKAIRLLGEKFDFLNPLGIQLEEHFHSATTRIKFHSFRPLQ